MAELAMHEALVQREEGGWDVEVPVADHAHTWAPNLRKARDFAREIVAAWLDVPLGDVAVSVVVRELADEIAAARSARRTAQVAARDSADANRHAVARLLELGLPERDVAVALDLSPQRVHQLRSA